MPDNKTTVNSVSLALRLREQQGQTDYNRRAAA
jgi:hypothetical protein